MSNSTQTFRGVVALEQGAKVHEFDSATTLIGTSVDVASHTVSVGKTLKLSQVDISCSVDGLAEVFDGATRIGTMRLGAGLKNSTLSFNPTKNVAASAILKVTFTAKSGPANVDVEALIQGAEF